MTLTYFKRRKSLNWIPYLAGISLGFFVFLRLETVPISGRRRLMLKSPFSFFSSDRKVADAAYQELLVQFKGRFLPSYSPESRMVEAVATKLIAALGERGRGISLSLSPNQPKIWRGKFIWYKARN
jgi:hypothetical protein